MFLLKCQISIFQSKHVVFSFIHPSFYVHVKYTYNVDLEARGRKLIIVLKVLVGASARGLYSRRTQVAAEPTANLLNADCSGLYVSVPMSCPSGGPAAHPVCPDIITITIKDN